MCSHHVYVWFQNITILRFAPPGISSLTSYFPFKNWAIETTQPVGIPNDHPCCGFGDFLDKIFWMSLKGGLHADIFFFFHREKKMSLYFRMKENGTM